MTRCVRCLALLLGLAMPALGQDRQDVTFSINQTTTFGQSVFVLGDLPELGGNDLRFSIKLEPSSYPIWKATVSLPANRSYSYRYYIRNDAAGQWGNAANGTALGAGPISASTGPSVIAPPSKTVFWHSMFSAPVLYWRFSDVGGSYQAVAMHDVGPGRSGSPGERRWVARGFGSPRRSIDFFFSNQSFTQFDPPDSSNYITPLDTMLVQDQNVFTYVPTATVSSATKRYTLSGGVPSTFITSAAMGETRRYRVITPRGYDQQPGRRYPVLYLHDGQNVFEPGTFGDWLADETAARMTRLGQMREVIMVGADNGPNRLNDYAAPDSGGWANGRYLTFMRDELKPVIDAQYRTLAGADDTGILGSSMGGQASLWFGWDATAHYRRLGVFSGAWNVFTSGFYDRVRSQPRRDALRIYLDSGDSGTSQDLFWTTVNLRDNLINPARAAGVGGACTLERDLRYNYGPGQIHNEGAWAQRLPKSLEFLFPASEAPNELAGLPTARPTDVDDDGDTDIDDLYAWEQGSPAPSSTLDVDRDGAIEPTDDRAALLGALRDGEVASITQ